MKKHTIISGPAASGKTWISKAIINQHSQNDVIQLTRIDKMTLIGLLLQTNIKLLVVDQCNEEDILKCLEILGKKNLRILFITQDKINNKDFPNSHIINLHNYEL